MKTIQSIPIRGLFVSTCGALLCFRSKVSFRYEMSSSHNTLSYVAHIIHLNESWQASSSFSQYLSLQN
jgi:hypothetical protein